MIKKIFKILFYVCGISFVASPSDGELKEYRLSATYTKNASLPSLVAINGIGNQLATCDPLLYENKESFQKSFGDAACLFTQLLAAEKGTGNTVVLYVLNNEIEDLFIHALNLLKNDSSYGPLLMRLEIVGLPSLCGKMSETFYFIKTRELVSVDDDAESTLSSDSEPDENNFMCTSTFKKWMHFLEDEDLKKTHESQKVYG